MILNIIKYGASEGLAKLAPFLTTLYVAKYLSPELFGKYSLIVVVFEILFIIVSFNIQATTRVDYFKLDWERFVTIKRNHFIISISFSALGLFALVLVGGGERFFFMLLLISALMRTGSIFIQSIFQCSKRVNGYIATNVMFVLVLSMAVLLFVHMGASYYSWVYAITLASAVQFFLALKLYGFEQFLSFVPSSTSYPELKSSFIAAALFMPQAIGWWCKTGADRLIISRFLGDEALGHYSLAFQLSSFIILSMVVLNLTVVPELNCFLKHRDTKSAKRLLLFAGIFLLVISLVTPYGADFLIKEFYSSQYLPATHMLYLLCLSLFPQGLVVIYVNVLYFVGDGKFVSLLISVSFFLQAVTNYLMVDIYGVNGLILFSFFVNVFVALAVVLRVNTRLNDKN